MNPVVEENVTHPEQDEELMHYGVKRRSGRYPWGSGDTPYQHSGDFLSRVQELKKQGLKETEIVEAMGLESTTQLRASYSVAKNERRRLDVARVKSLQNDGLGPTEIGKIMGINESSVRALMNENAERRMNQAEVTAKVLKKELEKKHMIDVGAEAERELNVSRVKFDEALYMLEAEGYQIHGVGVPQINRVGKQINMKVLCDPDITQAYAYQHMGEIQSLGDYHSKDGGLTFDKLEYPSSIDSGRVKIRYGDEGGATKDGVIEIRRGVKDLDLGNSHYAQVRIMVDGTHYLKGMAIYSDDLPAGTDIMFNTNKKTGTPKMDVLKKIKDDPDNPFGALIKANGQSYYEDSDGTRKLSAINKLKEEGDWDTMSKNLSSQFLSKQPMSFIKKQLKLTYDDYAAEYDEICSVSNPTLRKKLLLDFANTCDGATVHLKASALPGQTTRVILPVDKLSETEVYAPHLKSGTKVALIRYPHGGTFEIPELTVNNKNRAAKGILGNVTDAIGINAKVAERLSGADFDGDTVVVIPLSSKVQVKSTKPLRGLVGFDPKTEYPYREGMKVMPESMKQKQMGMISNLITDMTLKGAPESDLVRAVKHSMVVIDAPKHKLDYKESERVNGIAELKAKWQPKYDDDGNVVGGGGAATLLSKRKQTVRINERQGSGTIDPDTGKVSYKESGRKYKDKKGNWVNATTEVSRLSITDDVRTLSSGTPQENAYADYANKLKALANQARKEYKATGDIKYSSSAKEAYLTEVSSLTAKLNLAAKNVPRERRAQAVANSVMKAKRQDNPDMSKKEMRKAGQVAITNARASVSASSKRTRITITDREWDAIQAGAISPSKLNQILRYADTDALKARAMPRATTTLSTAKLNKAKSMNNSGYSIAEIAESLGVSPSTVSKYLNG